jgi:hypothetical protein
MRLKLPLFRYALKGGVTLERAHIARKEAETNGAATVAIVDAVDERREFLAPVIVGREQIRLVVIGRNQAEQHDADADWLIARHPRPDFLEAGEQKAGVARFVKTGVSVILPSLMIGVDQGIVGERHKTFGEAVKGVLLYEGEYF